MSDERIGANRLSYRVFVVTSTAAAVFIVLLVLYWSIQAILLTFAAVLFALAIGGMADTAARVTHVPRVVALVGVCLLFVGVTAGLSAWVGPRIADQMGRLSNELPEALDHVHSQVSSLGWLRLPSAQEFYNSSTDLIAPTLGVLRTAIGGVVAVVVILALGVYFAAQPQKYLELLLRVLPVDRRARFRDVILESGGTLQYWMLARAVCMLEVGVMTTIGLALLHIDLYIGLGVLAGLLNFVPNFGPVIAGSIAVLFASLAGPSTMFWVVGLYVGVQVVDNYVVGPLLEQRAVALPAAVNLIIQIAFGLLLGPLGLLLSTPLTIAGGVFVQRLYVEDLLGDVRTAE